MSRYFVAGGAGFIGSHMARRLLQRPQAHVVVYDNFSSGRAWHLPDDSRLTVVRGDLKDLGALTAAIAGSDVVFHFASNPDIAKAATQPDIDFWEGTYLTQNLLEAMRIAGVPRLIYASGSGVYGDTGDTAVTETYSPLLPISTYGASKLACEVLICSYTHMFDLLESASASPTWSARGRPTALPTTSSAGCSRIPPAWRSSATGSRASRTFTSRTWSTPLLLLHDRGWNGFDVFNVATEDYVTVRQIADLVAGRLGISRRRLRIHRRTSRLERGRAARPVRHLQAPRPRLVQPTDLGRGPDSLDRLDDRGRQSRNV